MTARQKNQLGRVEVFCGVTQGDPTGNGPPPEERDWIPASGCSIKIFRAGKTHEKDVEQKTRCDGEQVLATYSNDSGWAYLELTPGNYCIESELLDQTCTPYSFTVKPNSTTCIEQIFPFDFAVSMQKLRDDNRCEPNEDDCDILEEGDKALLRFLTSNEEIDARIKAAELDFEFHVSGAQTYRTETRGEAIMAAQAPGEHSLNARVSDSNSKIAYYRNFTTIPSKVRQIGGNISVTMNRSSAAPTPDLPLWVVIRKSTEALSFENYSRYMDRVLLDQPLPFDTPPYEAFKIEGDEGASNYLPPGYVDKESHKLEAFSHLNRKGAALPFNDVEAYRLLKVSTEAFLMVNCAVDLENMDRMFTSFDAAFWEQLQHRTGISTDSTEMDTLWQSYLKSTNGTSKQTLPYLALVNNKLRDSSLSHFLDDSIASVDGIDFVTVLRQKLTNPCLLELIYSYWMEEGMLQQTMGALSRRFQNLRTGTGRDPLANIEIDPLRPLNNLLWGYIQDEQHRLSVKRRAYEYNHHYGLHLSGKAIRNFRPADTRFKFLEAYHNMLYLATLFYKEDDDTTVIADAFPLLHALKDVHFLLSEGAHNQFGDLPSTSRSEIMMEQWILSRPEFREFLPGRPMVAYQEPWMDRVDAMKKLQGWTDVSISHFRNLAVFGERLLLSVRYGNWGSVDDSAQASNWARFWRSEIQGYVQAYRTATGVDLGMDITDVRDASSRYLPPAVHLRNRLGSQKKKARIT